MPRHRSCLKGASARSDMYGNANCNDGKTEEHSVEMSNSTPTRIQVSMPPVMPPEERTELHKSDEDKEARKVRLTGGALAKSLLDDSAAEPLPPRIRRPGDPVLPMWPKPPAPPKMAPLPLRGCKFNEELESHLNHLPFFTHNRYDRVAILKRIMRIKPLRGVLHKGRYFIEKDRHTDFDPRMDPEQLQNFLKADEKRARKYRTDGRVNRIVDLFMEKVMGWSTSRVLMPHNCDFLGSPYCLMWLGPSLAMKMLHQMRVQLDLPILFETIKPDTRESKFYIVNRLPIDIIFKDKENFYGMLAKYVMSPRLTCKNRTVDESLYLASKRQDCHDMEARGSVTRRACVHQNLSMSLKPCAVTSCPNFELPVCDHLYAFIPETITLTSFTSMLHFTERFKRIEDLRGAIFITKPAYLCNGRGIKFITELEQFEHFFHMLDGKATTRHGVVLQRYVECPRLFDKQKFTIRFFLLIIVLEKRRVVGFIHYGIALFAKLPYEPVERDDWTPEDEAKEGKKPKTEMDVGKRSIGRVINDRFINEMHLTNYISPERKARVREDVFAGRAQMMPLDEDTAFYLEDILPTKCKNSVSIYIQMLFVGQCIMDYIQPIVQGYPGTFQTICIDSLVDARNKLWVLEAGTDIFSGMLSIAPRQRQMMSAIIQESIGITLECIYKTHNNMPLYWNYEHDRKDFDAIYFAQDFNLFYETEIVRQTDYIFEKRQNKHLLLEERYDQCDEMRVRVEDRKQLNYDRKKKSIKERAKYAARVRAKEEEES